MTTPGTASNSEARKRLAEQNGQHVRHWDPAVVQLIEQARAEGAAEVVARIEALLADGPDTWSGYESRDTGWTFLQESVLDFTADLRAALRGPR